MTYHPTEDGVYIVLYNLSAEVTDPMINIAEDYCLDKVYYGSIDAIGAYDTCVFRVNKKQ